MQTSFPELQGLWLPLITPFMDGELDETSFSNLIRHYIRQPIDGFVLAATTGEEMTLTASEQQRIVSLAASEMSRASSSKPILMGVSGSDTSRVAQDLRQAESWPVDGFLISCPYYTRPSQQGLKAHFSALAKQTDHSIVIYNIPYRTGVNMSNETLLELAAIGNIRGVKDCCATPKQSYELIRQSPMEFSVLTGEDPFFYNALVHSADGAILATAHLMTEKFAQVREEIITGNQHEALALWNELSFLAELLFSEPSPAALKYCLWKIGLIRSPELRLPMVPVSDALAEKLDQHLEQLKAGSIGT